MALLYKLEQATIRLVQIQQKVLDITEKFKEEYSVIENLTKR